MYKFQDYEVRASDNFKFEQVSDSHLIIKDERSKYHIELQLVEIIIFDYEIIKLYSTNQEYKLIMDKNYNLLIHLFDDPIFDSFMLIVNTDKKKIDIVGLLKGGSFDEIRSNYDIIKNKAVEWYPTNSFYIREYIRKYNLYSYYMSDDNVIVVEVSEDDLTITTNVYKREEEYFYY